MIDIQIDGQTVSVPEGSMVMDAAQQVGRYVPHFCYHKKLSIAANCRMCLVEVEKAPKPLPACATPVTAGMVVHTHSPKAVAAQKAVMEFLLINHPLDCPICDQGGECQLQDLAVGYGSGQSRYQEEKRVVFHKSIGPLVSAEEMSRCIHCTRCVRFGQEIAGIMELGMAGRGEHSEILSFVGQSVDSELSGNMIDICPVGALTSKPFRYKARTWELARRRSVSPHDSLGSNVILQVKSDEVLRVVPVENDDINECWLADRDRFAYEGLTQDRVTQPWVKQADQWVAVDWETALTRVAEGLQDIVRRDGADNLAALASPQSTLEELTLLKKLMLGLGSDHTEFRLHQQDFRGDKLIQGLPWLGMRIAEFAALKRVLVIGANLRKDQPLLAQRLRQSAKRGTRVMTLAASSDPSLIPGLDAWAQTPHQWPLVLALMVKAAAGRRQLPCPEQALRVIGLFSEQAALVTSLASRADGFVERLMATEEEKSLGGVFLGIQAESHPHFADLQLLAAELSKLLHARLGYFTLGANALAGHVVNFKGADPRRLLDGREPKSFSAALLLNLEPDADTVYGKQALEALRRLSMVVVMTPFMGQAKSYADVILPISPFSETSGTFISAEGRVQSFQAAVKPKGQTRPGWKVLRVLGNMLGLEGFDFNASDEVKTALLGSQDQALTPAQHGQAFLGGLDNGMTGSLDASLLLPAQSQWFLPVTAPYASDAIVRRADALQSTRDAQRFVAMHEDTASKLGVSAGQLVELHNAALGQMLSVTVHIDSRLAPDVFWLTVGYAETSGLGPMGELVEIRSVAAAKQMAAV